MDIGFLLAEPMSSHILISESTPLNHPHASFSRYLQIRGRYDVVSCGAVPFPKQLLGGFSAFVHFFMFSPPFFQALWATEKRTTFASACEN